MYISFFIAPLFVVALYYFYEGSECAKIVLVYFFYTVGIVFGPSFVMGIAYLMYAGDFSDYKRKKDAKVKHYHQDELVLLI
jgi:hypothetical protein